MQIRFYIVLGAGNCSSLYLLVSSLMNTNYDLDQKDAASISGATYRPLFFGKDSFNKMISRIELR